MLKVGDKIETWFSDEPDGKSTVLAVEPYHGIYKQWFANDVRVTAPRTRRGWMELSLSAEAMRAGALPLNHTEAASPAA